MIVVAVEIHIRPEQREQIIQQALAVSEATRQEAACQSYRFWADLEDPTTFFLFEEWDSEEAIAQHFQTPHMIEFQKHLPTILASAPIIKKYEVAGTGTL